MPRALDGLRVIDVTQVMAGPFCAMLLADLGADVIKIEPKRGDSTRTMPGAIGTDSPSFNAVNRGKRSVVLDLKTREGADALMRLATAADIVIENYRPGVMKALGLDYATLSALNPAARLRLYLRLRTNRADEHEGRFRPRRAGRCQESCR